MSFPLAALAVSDRSIRYYQHTVDIHFDRVESDGHLSEAAMGPDDVQSKERIVHTDIAQDRHKSEMEAALQLQET